ncbi:hypothetical protein [Burkholderia pseudomallei]|uniref:hypothetical protein n=1 Tax=Burkholderia pseudomallei TaxID=28450 RepID=UPI00052B0152|nr:hypothetical protein [Burkholderia pseudomallei]AIV84050.1 hypothetical protein X978_709 [Burkholderia pseudomallei MSHR3965]KGW15308.1 hypothetical protein X980_1264 [Burkholderia pseudomallei MSHR4000]MBO7846237.1 hypothetical protein [Burkholderia pseudomallei]ONC51713.1 hypothetical protein AQ917_05335 [Burkholderia pseudomallei]
MREIFETIHKKKAALLDHPVFPQLESVTLPEIKEMMRVWSPLLIHLAMTFRDINRMYYHYEKPENELEIAINDHVDVDTEHWHMMVSDIKTLGVNNRAFDCESAINVIWDDLGGPVRKYMYSLVSRARQCGSCPLLKMASMEAGEATSKVFFTTSRRLAAAYEADTGNTLRYLGAEHIDSELDHSINESVFFGEPLSADKRAQAQSIVDDHFRSFIAFLDYKYEVNKLALAH